MTRALAAAAVLAATPPLFAQAPFPPGPGPYDPAVPTPAEARGFDTGTTFSTWRDVERVVDAIAAASGRVRVEPYGTTPENRSLRLAWVTSPAQLARLDSLRAANRAFLEGASGELPDDHPVFVWLSFGVHGDEAASTEAALELLYHLAAARDPATVAWLDAAVVVIDPLLNPDGHERYAAWYRSVAGPAPDPDPEAREHRPPWPGGRTNHWNFDLNRDWAWGVQPETRGRRAVYLATLPQVHVDFHEMDAGSTYFFFPPAQPVHVLYPESTDRWGRVFGEANARAFDARGWAYYTEEDFDLFYPGYGDSWPSFYGATGMTYEQAGGGSAGVAIDRPGLGRLTLTERALHHLVAALTTIETAVAHRTERLADFADFWRAPGRAAPGAPAVWLLPADDPEARELAALLHAQGIGVDTLAAWSGAADLTPYPHAPRAVDSLPPGTLVVRSDQPLGRYLAALLSPSTALPDTTLFYDVTG
ncbi:MAG TPA: M14 family zinc carboxypeptidase, partial [Gemmatimonadota bacterium]|nr:M14 family zinc carboxypeptidase [Gemmatimonadota bacterium]